MARAFDPLLRRLFPGIPEGHPASAAIVMNLSANMLGLDNAATPLGLKAMKELQALNPRARPASNDQILFLVINASAITVVPTAILTYRAQLGAADPTDVFLPLLIATFCSTMVGLLVTARVQKLPLGNPVMLGYLGGVTLLVGLLVGYFATLDKETLERQTSLLANFLIFTLIVGFVALAATRRVATLRGLRRRGQGGLRGRDRDRPLPGGDAGGGRRPPRERGARPAARRGASRRSPASASTRAGSTRCRWRSCARSPAAARAA